MDHVQHKCHLFYFMYLNNTSGFLLSSCSWWWINMLSLCQGLNVEPSLMRCCHIPCGGAPHWLRCQHQQQTATWHPSPYQEVLLCEYFCGFMQVLPMGEILINTSGSSNKTLLYTRFKKHSYTHKHSYIYFFTTCAATNGLHSVSNGATCQMNTAGQLTSCSLFTIFPSFLKPFPAEVAVSSAKQISSQHVADLTKSIC